MEYIKKADLLTGLLLKDFFYVNDESLWVLSVYFPEYLGLKIKQNGPRLRRIWDYLQGAPKVAYFTYSAFGATPKMIPKTSKMVQFIEFPVLS
jgi:hypothetical protein